MAAAGFPKINWYVHVFLSAIVLYEYFVYPVANFLDIILSCNECLSD